MKHKIIFGTLIATTLILAGCNGTTTVKISKEEAQSIALKDADLTAEQVTFIKTDLDTDDGQTHYDVEFYTEDGVEYDYNIDPETGEVLEYDFDVETIYH